MRRGSMRVLAPGLALGAAILAGALCAALPPQEALEAGNAARIKLVAAAAKWRGGMLRSVPRFIAGQPLRDGLAQTEPDGGNAFSPAAVAQAHGPRLRLSAALFDLPPAPGAREVLPSNRAGRAPPRAPDRA
ncbi:hypothetical protein [Desulfovibrio sp.]